MTVLDNGTFKHAPLSIFAKSKSGQVLMTYSLDAAYHMTKWHKNYYQEVEHTNCTRRIKKQIVHMVFLLPLSHKYKVNKCNINYRN